MAQGSNVDKGNIAPCCHINICTADATSAPRCEGICMRADRSLKHPVIILATKKKKGVFSHFYLFFWCVCVCVEKCTFNYHVSAKYRDPESEGPTRILGALRSVGELRKPRMEQGRAQAQLRLFPVSIHLIASRRRSWRNGPGRSSAHLDQ